MKKLYLVDVSSLFFRAFYAVRPLSSPTGIPVNAIYGFLSMLLKLMKEERPDHIVFCHDRKEPSFRKDLYLEYKANRTEMPEELVPQLPYIKRWAEALGIPSVDVMGFEADDLIGTLVQMGKEQNLEVFIVSGDKDFAQLLGPHIWLLDTMKNTRMGPVEVKEKWGIRPDQMIDYLALVGDSSDNVPGVSGIGPKGAVKLLQDFQTLDGIYQNLNHIKGALQEKLKQDREKAYLSQKLVTIVTNAPLSKKFEDYHLRAVHQVAVRDLLSELNFRGFEKSLKELPHWGGLPQDLVSNSNSGSNSGSVQPQNSELSSSGDLLAETPKVPGVANAEPEKVLEVLGWPFFEISLAELREKLPVGAQTWGHFHQRGLILSWEKQVVLVQAELADLAEFLNSRNLMWKGHDLKSLWHQLGLARPLASWDSMLAAYVLRAGEPTDLEKVYARWTRRSLLELPTPQERIGELMQLESALKSNLFGQEKIFEELEVPLLPILYSMEQKGVALDKELLQIQGAELAKEISDLEVKIYEAAGGGSFNIASPKQLAQILFEKLSLTPGKKTKTGYSTDNEVLQNLKEDHFIVPLILTYRELTKLKSTYVDALPLLIKEDGRIHSTFNQALTTTGRLSSTDPNLQNIPIKTERGARVRAAFVAAPNLRLLSVDYSQIELRILAHYSGDQNLIAAFLKDQDIHAATASEIFSVDLAAVTNEQRRAAKAVNFGIAYGQGAFGLAETLGISRGESAQIIQRYFERFPGVRNYIDSTTQLASENGYVETLDGRRRYIEQLKSSNAMIRKFGERAAINAPIQGTASDLVKKAMINLWKAGFQNLILQVHDELIFEGTEESLHKTVGQIVHIMESVAQLKVPLKANYAIGRNWDEAH